MTEDDRPTRRKAFIEKHRHELAGLVLDGATFNRTGGELALWCRSIMHRTDAKLAQIFDDLLPQPKVPLTPGEKAVIDAEAAKVTAGRQPPVKK